MQTVGTACLFVRLSDISFCLKIERHRKNSIGVNVPTLWKGNWCADFYLKTLELKVRFVRNMLALRWHNFLLQVFHFCAFSGVKYLWVCSCRNSYDNWQRMARL